MTKILTLALCGSLLLGADAPAESGLPPAACLALRLVDQARATTRWATSPYPALAATPWGRRMIPAAGERPGIFQLVTHLLPIDQGLFTVRVVAGQPIGQLEATLGVTAPATFAFISDQLERTPGTLRARISLAPYRIQEPFATRQVDWSRLMPLSQPAVATPEAATADLEAVAMARIPGLATSLPLTASWTVAPYGLHERVRLSGLKKEARKPSASLPASLTAEALAGLPATTLWAVATTSLPEVVEQVPGFDPTVFDTWATTASQPPWSTVRSQLGGATLWAEQAAPFPVLSLVVTMPQSLGQMVLAALDRQFEFSPGSDGTHLGAVGFVPIQAGWADGQLVITTHGLGLPAALTRPGGFTTLPSITKALARLASDRSPEPGDRLLIAASRGGDAWAALASLNPWLARHQPDLATLANDLRRAGTFGFAGLTRTDDALVLDAGGLFGGPLANTLVLDTFFKVTFEPPARPHPDAEAPAKPTKVVEF